MTVAAGLAVCMFVGVFVWQATARNELVVSNQGPQEAIQADSQSDYSAIEQLSKNSEVAAANPYSELGTSIIKNAVIEYDKATKDGSPSDAGIAAVQKYAASINPGVAYTTYAASDIKTDPDTSKDRVLSYRADLRVALEPLLANKDYELDLFAQYVDSKDPKYLSALAATIANYKLAIANAEKVVVPSDGASYHASILTSLSQFAATLQAMTDNASDPLASAALLRAYTGAQGNLVASFNAIGGYAARKVL